MALHGTLLFHLNLCYSAIEREEHGEVLARCYAPLLGLLERLPWLRLAIEASGHTLELIHALDPAWVERLAAHWRAGRVEFIGSGDTQLIGPIVPASVNLWNQRLGQERYEELLGRRPTVALVNEMAWSQGLVDAYLDAGYSTLVMEWNNPHKHHREWPAEWRYRLARTESPRGRGIDLAWVDAIAFQKFQRAVHDDIDVEDYVEWVLNQAGEGTRHLFLYASDAEIFDFRPGRYEAEAALGSGSEWDRMAVVLEALHAAEMSFGLPSQLRREPELAPKRTLCLRSAADPIPVKKQPKYNVTRWALTGRDDVHLNSLCFGRAKELERDGGGPDEWRELCRTWGSDLRTHLTERRWRNLSAREGRVLRPSERPVAPVGDGAGQDPTAPRGVCERRGRRLNLTVGEAQLQLSLGRGLAIESLTFACNKMGSLIGTLPHGALDDIDWAADFYSGHLVVDVPAGRRVTDLVPVEPEVCTGPGWARVKAHLATPLGPITKHVTLTPGELRLRFDLSLWGRRPLGSTRLGYITFEPDAFGSEVCLTSACGGPPESFPLDSEFDHSSSVSPLVSARAAFGSSDGRLSIDDGRRGIELAWDPEEAAALPLVTHRKVAGRRFLRVAFSLGEVDETARPEGHLPSFQLRIRPSLGAA